jgi:S1-C subfamily serine protease
MKLSIVSVLLACAVVSAPIGLDAGSVTAESDLKRAFEQYTGIHLAFDRTNLPEGRYYDAMPPLSKGEQLRAARIALQESKKYPAGYLKSIGLKCIGIFRECASAKGDGFRPYDSALHGYRYYGIWNGRDAVAAAYYSDRQLPLTLHHEIFHLIDSKTDDSRFADAISGRQPYAAPKLPATVIAKLRDAGRGSVLEDAVSDYCRKNSTEDKAETARYLMSHLADSLVQAATRPTLRGSQRILHVLTAYELSQSNHAMNIQWFVDVALSSNNDGPAVTTTPVEPQNPYLKNVNAVISDATVRNAISRVQPSCVRLDNASGVNLSPNGYILTAAHVARRLGQTLNARLPDGYSFQTKCVAIDQNLDLAMLHADADIIGLPFAPLAPRPPATGSRIICIGQPGATTPSGKPTRYQPFTVSTGRIRNLMDDPLGDQSLGRVSHDAWTYWGHSGSPLFDENGQIVAMHNSWDSKTSMRHAVPYEAIVHFLDQSHVPYTTGD